MQTSEFISQIISGNSSKAKETLNDILSAKAFESLENRKIAIAQSMFSTESTEVQEEEVELTQEEYDQLDELSKKSKYSKG